MNENVWRQDAQRRHERIAEAVRRANGRDGTDPRLATAGRTDPVGPGPLIGAVVLGIAAGVPLLVIGVGAVAAVAVREAVRRWRRTARPAATARPGMPAWS